MMSYDSPGLFDIIKKTNNSGIHHAFNHGHYSFCLRFDLVSLKLLTTSKEYFDNNSWMFNISINKNNINSRLMLNSGFSIGKPYGNVLTHSFLAALGFDYGPAEEKLYLMPKYTSYIYFTDNIKLSLMYFKKIKYQTSFDHYERNSTLKITNNYEINIGFISKVIEEKNSDETILRMNYFF